MRGPDSRAQRMGLWSALFSSPQARAPPPPAPLSCPPVNRRPDSEPQTDRPPPPPEAPRQRFGLHMPRWMRLARRGDFQRVYREGSRARGGFFTVVAAPNPRGETRLGLSIGRRVFRGAVDRNRLRRLIREAFRLEYECLPKGFDLIAVGSEPAARPTLEEARRELVRAAERAARRSRERLESGAPPRAPQRPKKKPAQRPRGGPKP